MISFQFPVSSFAFQASGRLPGIAMWRSQIITRVMRLWLHTRNSKLKTRNYFLEEQS